MESTSNQTILSFWRHILVDCLQLEEIRGNTLWNHRNPIGDSQTTLYIDIFASMPLRQLEPVWQSWGQPFYRLTELSGRQEWAKLNISTVRVS